MKQQHHEHATCSCGQNHNHAGCAVHGAVAVATREQAQNTGADSCGCERDHSAHCHGDCGESPPGEDEDPAHSHAAACSCGHEHQRANTPAKFTVDVACSCGNCGDEHPHGEHDDHAGHNHGDDSNTKQIAIRLAVCGALFVGGFLVPPGWLQMALWITSYVLAGYEHIISAVKNIIKLRPFDETLLMTIATVGAFALGHYEESAAVMILFTLGQMFENMAIGRSKRNIEELMNLDTDTATLLIDGKPVAVTPQQVNIGDLLLVKPYEKFPLDGVVAAGEGFADMSALTGESVPVPLEKGKEVYAGTVNGATALEVTATAICADSTAAKIAKLAQDAVKHKATSERFITKFARVYTPIVVALAVLVAVVPPLLSAVAFGDSLYTALTLLVISCPCALVISVPLSFVAGIGRGSKLGILFKGSSALETLAKTAGVAFDKTGTLTFGSFEVKSMEPASGNNEQLLAVTRALESMSSHPIARSIAAYAESQNAALLDVESLEERAGRGVVGTVGGKQAAAGNAKLMAEYGIDIGLAEDNATVVHVALDGEYLGKITVGDTIKPGSAPAMAALRDMGIQTMMLTGDTAGAAQTVAQQTGVGDYRAALLPGDKVDEILKLKQQLTGPVAFIGDGVNDAPVISAADVGVAMGALGSDAAIEAADVVLMNDEPGKIVAAIDCAKRTRKIATQNIVFVLLVKAAIMGISIFFVPSMWLAIIADVGTSLLAVLNATRIFAGAAKNPAETANRK